MALIGVSLIVASVIFFCFRPPAWLPGFFANLRQGRIGPPQTPSLLTPPDDSKEVPVGDDDDGREPKRREEEEDKSSKADRDRATMPPPPIPVIRQEPKIQIGVEEPVEGDQTTPKASAKSRDDPVPTFSLSGDLESTPSPSRPAAAAAKPVTNGLMGPPPPRLPTLAPTPSSRLSARNAPLPNRGPPGASSTFSSSSLAPPPTHNAKPQKPSRQVSLTPGHSPLDWARLSSSPTADLRGLPGGANAPYLRVTPSMLKRQTGRRGTDAWSVFGGRVYNISPYLPFHPGGEPELLRGAGRDGTRLFGEVHPWVNYETMLSACLVGILVDEDDGKEGIKMEEMD